MTREPKPPWRALPAAVRQQAEVFLGAKVRRAVRVWGGYAPSATFRLLLTNGQHVVFKGISNLPGARMRRAGFSKEEIERQSAFQRRILDDEERAYRDLGARLLPWSPAFYGSFAIDDWLVLLLEDVGPAQVPPWTADLTRAALIDYAAFHAATLGQTDFPAWVRRDRHHQFGHTWRRLAEDPGGIDGLAGLAIGQTPEASTWIRRHLPTLDATARRLELVPVPHAVLHFDTRSDNLRIQSGGRLRLFDWPFVAIGPHEFDVAAFAQSITTEGGPEPEQCIDWYATGIEVRRDALEASIAAIAGYFAESAWRPPIPGVPRVRSIQRRQLRTSLAWCARSLRLDPPEWLAAVPD